MTEFREAASGLMLPVNIADKPPCGKCFVCGYEAFRPKDMERHVIACAAENGDRFAAEHSPRRGPQDPANWDVEYEQWARGGPNRWDNWFKEHRIDRAQYERDRASR